MQVAHKATRLPAAAVEVPISQLSDEARQSIAQEYGYKTIGSELPNNVTLTDIVKTLPSEVGLTTCGMAVLVTPTIPVLPSTWCSI